MLDLIERLEKATGGNFELEHQIAEAVYPHLVGFRQPDGVGWVGPGWSTRQPPPYTASMEAALSLVAEALPGHGFSIGHLPVSDDANHEEHHVFGCLLYEEPHVASPRDGLGHGATVALACCVALLRAIQTKEAGHG